MYEQTTANEHMRVNVRRLRSDFEIPGLANGAGSQAITVSIDESSLHGEIKPGVFEADMTFSDAEHRTLTKRLRFQITDSLRPFVDSCESQCRSWTLENLAIELLHAPEALTVAPS